MYFVQIILRTCFRITATGVSRQYSSSMSCAYVSAAWRSATGYRPSRMAASCKIFTIRSFPLTFEYCCFFLNICNLFCKTCATLNIFQQQLSEGNLKLVCEKLDIKTESYSEGVLRSALALSIFGWTQKR